jgi:acyl-CoA thioester hydrolase
VTVQSPYRSVQRVFFDDLDALNILHNVRYLLFMERARGEMFNALGFRWEDELSVNPDKFSVVAETQVQYLKPVRGEGEIAVVVYPSHIGNTSLIVQAKVQSMDSTIVYAQGHARMVRLDPKTFKPCPWSPRFREAMTDMKLENT